MRGKSLRVNSLTILHNGLRQLDFLQVITKIIIQKNAPVTVGVTLLFFFMHSSITETVR